MPMVSEKKHYGPRVFDMEQRSAAWYKIHCGRVTASRMCDLMAYSKAKGKEGTELKSRADYRDELIAERLTGRMSQHFVSDQMKRGIEEEAIARGAYEIDQDCDVDEVGFVMHSTYGWAGCSPDGLIGASRGLEIKNLTTVNHLALWKTKIVPSDYYDQIQWNLFICEFHDWHFVSYDSRLRERAPHLQLLIIPVQRDEKRIAELEAEGKKMDAEIKAAIAELDILAGKPREVSQ
jgi:YqaJ-like viral recombinase domain